MLIIAEHPQFGKVRTIENEGRMWFCAADVAQALGYVNTNDAIARRRVSYFTISLRRADGRR